MKPFQLASGGSLLTQSTKISPSGLVDDSIVRNVQVPMLHGPSQGLIAPKQPIQEIVPDAFPSALSGTVGVMVEQAFKLEDRKAQIEADEAVIRFRRQANDSFNGSVGEDGSLQGGYSNTKNREAMDSFKGYKESIDSIVSESLDSISPSARAKAALRIQASREDFVNNGVSHYQRELRNQESNLREQDGQLLQEEISTTGTKPFLNGRVQEFLRRYPDENIRQQKLGELVTNMVQETYNKTYAAASQDKMNITPTMNATEAAVKAYKEIQELVPVELDNKVQTWLQDKTDEAQRQDKVAEKERRTELKYGIQKEAPDRFSSAIINEDYEGLNEDFKAYKSIFPDPDTASDKAVGTIKDSLFSAAMSLEGKTVDQKREYLNTQAAKLFKKVELNDVESGKILHAIEVEIPDKMRQHQNQFDQDVLNDQALRFDKLKRTKFQPGQKLSQKDIDSMPISDPPVEMLAENKLKFHKLGEDYEKGAVAASKGEISGHSPERAKGLFNVYMEGLKDGSPLTEGQQDRIRMWVSEGSVLGEDAAKAFVLNKKVDTASERVPAFKKTEEYKAVLSVINEADTVIVGRDKPMPKPGKPRTTKDSETYLEWVREAEIGKAQFRLELETANATAIKNNKPFSPNDFLRDWVRIKLNKGSVASPSFGDHLIKKYKQGFAGPKIREIVTGEKDSIMEDL